MSANVKISIGIPTYNGEKYLAQSIESVLTQLSEDPVQQIEILISDNASTDGTGAIAKRYVEKFPHIVRYTCNSQNIGYDRNVDNLFRVANGEYLWLLGDDDMLMPGALQKIFSEIARYGDIAVFCLPPSFLNVENEKKTWNRQFVTDILCNDGNEFLQRSLWSTSAVSSLCIRRIDWNAESLDKYIGSQWIHIGGMLEIMRHPVRAFIFADEMVVVRVQNPRWSGHGNQLEIGLKHLAVFESIIKLGYDSRTFQFFRESRYSDNLKSILFLKPSGIKSKMKIAKLMIHFFNAKPNFWMLHLPLLFVPNFITDGLISVVRRFRSALR
ncbi:MAG: glycosyltransferase family 2 protein [Sideroxydans sp.]|nr:glycosyltransferase family 2 protein [Sideroxydans sp.]